MVVVVAVQQTVVGTLQTKTITRGLAYMSQKCRSMNTRVGGVYTVRDSVA